MKHVGIDIGGTNIKLAVVGEGGKVLVNSAIKTHGARRPEDIVADIVAEVKRLSEGIEYNGIGIGCPGAIDSQGGFVEYSPNLQWRHIPLKDMVSKVLNKPVKIANDASVAALGEHRYGAGVGYSDTAMITLGTGVGGGIVVNNQLFEGFRSMGAEIGHTVIRVGGEQCTCGRRGCFEAYASATALIRETRKMMESDIKKESKMWDFCGFDTRKRKFSAVRVHGSTAFECSRQGDPWAKRVADTYIRCLAEGVLNVIAIFRSQAVILGGGVAAEISLPSRVQKFVDELRYGGRESLPTKVLAAKLGNDAGVVGAAALLEQ